MADLTNLNCYVTLKNNVKVPALGIGTTHHGGYNHETMVYALKECGYRHIDTAKRYGVEEYLAEAIHDSGVPRSEIFLTTKLWPKDYGDHKKSRAAAFGSMARLDTDYIDLYMMHWPVCPSSITDPKKCLAETWRELEILLDEGRFRAIGVSNFMSEDIESLLDSPEISGVVPHVNQCEYHPYQNAQMLKRFCEDRGIIFEGHCPLAKGRILDKEPVLRVAKMVGKSPAQVLIRWSLQNGAITIPKSTRRERVMQNFQSLTFELPQEAMDILDNLHTDMRIIDIDLQKFKTKLERNLPDGYKMKDYPCSLPNCCRRPRKRTLSDISAEMDLNF